jgi:triphosphatase
MPEIELKLAAGPDRMQELRQALESMASASTSVPSILTSIYYDSTDLKLRRHHLNFRVRERDGHRVQTLKTDGSNGGDHLSRGEWEDAIPGDQPDPECPQTGPQLRNIIAGGELRPLFTTVVRRTSIELEPRSSAQIEAAIDEGEIRSLEGEAVEPVCEIELELKSGDAGALYDVALRLLDVAPLRIETRSKADRGYRLVAIDGRTTQAVYANPAILDSSMTVESALQSIGRECLGHLLRNEPAALTDQPEGVHQMRVAARRLRSALSAVKPMVPAEHYRWALEELKWLAGALGSARNWSVFAASLLEPVERALPVETDLRRLSEAVEQRRQAAYDCAREAIGSQRYTAVMLRLAQWFETRGWRDQPASEQAALLFATIGEVAPGLIERRWRAVRKRSKRFGELSQQQRHKLRIALKKQRYTIEFLKSLFDNREVKAMEKRQKPLQDSLGYLNDVRTAHNLVDELARHVNQGGSEIGRAGGIVLGWHDRGLIEQEPKLRKHVRRLRRAKPFWPRVHHQPRSKSESPSTSGQKVVGDHNALTQGSESMKEPV